MIGVVLALFLAAAQPTDATGDLVVNVAAGTEVFVDGEFYGVSSTEGQTVRGLAVGAHKVELKAPNGGVASFNVNIIEAKTQTINVSPLGFRLKPKSETPVAAVRILSDITPCTVSVGDATAEKTSHELNFTTVPTGRQKLVIDCGGTRHVEAMLDLAAEELQIVEPDFTKKVARVIAHRRRVTALSVSGGQDEIVNASMPVEWKRALSSAAGASHAIRVVPVSYTMVQVTFRCASREIAAALVDRLRAQSVVDRVEIQGVRTDSDGTLLGLRVRFNISAGP